MKSVIVTYARSSQGMALFPHKYFPR